MVLSLVMLIAGFALLIKGADVFVDASVNIAKKLNIPSILIGLTIVSLGTSAPEIVISVNASIRGSNELAIGNVIGSNVFNMIFIVGLCAMVKPFAVNIKELAKDYWIAIAATVVLLLLKLVSGDYIPRLGAFVLLAAFAVYMIQLIRPALKNKKAGLEADQKADQKEYHQKSDEVGHHSHSGQPMQPVRPLHISILVVVLGCGLIVLGGHITVTGAMSLAEMIGVTERVIALTVVAVGTSLPELVTSLVACKKGETDVALGNVVGSSIFNILFILGLAGVISPLAINETLQLDVIFLILGSVLMFLLLYTGSRLTRTEGFVMVAINVTYMLFIIAN